MALRDPVYGYPSSGGRIDFATTSKCRYLELLRYPNLPFSSQFEGELDDTSLLEWLNKDLTVSSTSTRSYQAPSGGLRLLIGVCDFSPEQLCPTLSFRRDSFRAIEEHLGLPEEFLKSITGNTTQTFKFSRQNRGNEPFTCLVFKLAFFRPSFYQLALSYSKQTRLTHGLLLTKGLNNIPIVPQLLSGLENQRMRCEQPLLLALLSTEQVIDSCIERLNISDWKLNELEATMGQHEYDDLPKGNPLELDFLATTRALNHISGRVGVDVSRLSSILVALEKILDWGKEIMESQIRSRDGEIITTTEEVTDSFHIVNEKIDYLAGNCRVLIFRGEYEEKRARSLIQVVYQYMAQKDIKVNIKLAESSAFLAKASKEDSAVMRTIAIESKKDSSSMKTIAILGMFFLPGTFVAAVFAMPVFNWDGDGAPFVKEGFLYYWAVVIPLTFLVLAVWAFAMLLPWRAWLPGFRSLSEPPELGIGLTRINP